MTDEPRPAPPRRWENSSNWRTAAPATASPSNSSTTNTNSPAKWRTANSDNATRPIRSFPSNDNPATRAAFAEGRRLYVGNMPYMAKKEDVVELFNPDSYKIERVDISIDPFTGRNPSYCFVELASKEQAELAMQELNDKVMLGRPIRVKPGVPRSSRGNNDNDNNTTRRDAVKADGAVFERWERDDASKHWFGYAAQGRRLYVGGLPRMPSQSVAETEVRKLFEGFKIEAISKVISPHVRQRAQPGNHFYVFVDMESPEEAIRAKETLNGPGEIMGSLVRISMAKGDSNKPAERERWRAKHEPEQNSNENITE